MLKQFTSFQFHETERRFYFIKGVFKNKSIKKRIKGERYFGRKD